MLSNDNYNCITKYCEFTLHTEYKAAALRNMALMVGKSIWSTETEITLLHIEERTMTTISTLTNLSLTASRFTDNLVQLLLM